MTAASPAPPRPEPEAPAPPFVPLETERLVLRPLEPGDAARLHRLVNDWEVAKALARVPFPYPRALADEWIASTRARIAAGEAFHLAIAARGDGALLGCVGLTLDRGGAREAELGYWVGRGDWGRGLAAEAAGRLARWALAHLELDRLRASALSDNARSEAVLRRIGFAPAGEGTEDYLSRGGPMPVRRFAAGRADLAATLPAAPPPAPAPAAPDARPVLLVAACALVDPDGRVLLARRPEGRPMAGLWEFPGGKVAPGETPEAGLIRELREELGIDVAESCLAPFTFASHAYEGFHLLMPLYLCRRWEGAVAGREGQALAWVRPARLGDYAVPDADRPLVAMLRDFL